MADYTIEMARTTLDKSHANDISTLPIYTYYSPDTS